MKTRFFLLIFLAEILLIPKGGFAQSISADSVSEIRPYKNAVYLEAGGNGILGSLNYERLFPNQKTGQTISLRVGGLLIPNGNQGGKQDFFYFVPMEVSSFSGRKVVKFEFGLGATLLAHIDSYRSQTGVTKTNIEYYAFPMIRFGARWMPENQPYFMRAGLLLIVMNNDFLFPVFPWVGASFGYRFGR